MLRRKRIFIFIICNLFFACKKDSNIDSPSVQILQPSGLQTFNVFDTINVKASVSDADGLKSISIVLTNAQSSQVLPPVSVPVTSNSMTFTWPYILSDIHLASGQYFITVTASNGTHSTNANQKINVITAPTKRIAIYAITRNASNVQTWKIDTLFHSTAGPLVNGNYSGSDISSYYQQLFIAASDTGNVNAISVPSGTSLWNVQGITSNTPYFTNIYSYGDAAYVSLYNGYVKYYDHKGNIQTVIAANANYYPLKTFAWSNYLFTEEKSTTSSAENLVLYYAQSGVGYQQVSIPGPIVAMYGMDANDVFIFGNQTSGAPYMQDYNISGNIFYTPITLPNAKLLSVAQLSSGSFLMGFDNGMIYQYTYNPSNFVAYLNGINASHIRYNALNNQLVLTSNKVVQEYNCGVSSATLVYSITMPDSVLDIQILYNK